MSAGLRHPLRLLGRLTWLGAELAYAAGRYPFAVTAAEPQRRRRERSGWLQNHCQRTLRVLNVRLEQHGALPGQGLLVCNHLSYLDILALGSLAPMVFVAKREVQEWPVFGALAGLAGTIFVQRTRADIPRSSQEIQGALEQDSLVVLFPEGTSSGGETVLPFKSALLAAAGPGGGPIWPACIHYPAENGDVAEGLCFWRDMSLLPHLLNILGRKEITVAVRIGEPVAAADRKEQALLLQAQVLEMYGQCQDPGAGLSC